MRRGVGLTIFLLATAGAADVAGEDACSPCSMRRHREVVTFRGSTPLNQTFETAPLQITPESEVCLDIGIKRPFDYGLKLKETRDARTEPGLLNIAGSGGGVTPPTLQAVLGIMAETEKEMATAGEEAAEATSGGTVTPNALKQGARDATLLYLAPNVAVPPGKVASALLTQAAAAMDKATSDLLAIDLRRDGAERLKALRELHAQIMDGSKPASPVALVQSAQEVIGKLSDAEKTPLQARLASLKEKLDALQDAFRAAIQDHKDYAEEGCFCRCLKAFDGGQRVTITAGLVRRPPLTIPAKKPSTNADLIKAVKAADESLVKAHDTLADALKKSGSDPSGAAAANAAKDEAAKKGDASKPQKPDAAAGEADDEAPEKTAAQPVSKELGEASISFDVLKPIHVQLGVGFPVTWLRAVDYSLERAGADSTRCVDPSATEDDASQEPDSGAAEDSVCLVPKNDAHRVLPTFYVAVNLIKPQYPYDTWRPRNLVPSFILGVPLSEPGKQFMLGLGINLFRGVQVVGGVHLGRVTRLRSDFQENVRFIKPDADFQVADAAYTPYVAGAFFGVSIDAASIGSIFGGGNGKKNTGDGE